eukprot:gene6549-8996_t
MLSFVPKYIVRVAKCAKINKKNLLIKSLSSKGGGDNHYDEDKHEIEDLTLLYEKITEGWRIDLEFTPEELAQHAIIAKEYSRQKMKLHNLFEKDLATKSYLQQDALNALPPALREQAKIVDETTPPAHRPWPVWKTPPIKGFNPKDYIEKEEDMTSFK